MYRSRSRDRDERGPQEAMEDREAERQRAKDRHKSKRRKPSIWWDVAPRGFEHISPLQYKAMQGTHVYNILVATLSFSK